jgi:hypothetical protein
MDNASKRAWLRAIKTIPGFRKGREELVFNYAEPRQLSYGLDEDGDLSNISRPLIVLATAKTCGIKTYLTSVPQKDYTYVYPLNKNLHSFVDEREWDRYIDAEITNAMIAAYEDAVKTALKDFRGKAPVVVVHEIAKSLKSVTDDPNPRIYIINNLAVV